MFKKKRLSNLLYIKYLIRYVFNTATKDLEVKMVLEWFKNLWKELMSLWNLTKVVIFLTTKKKSDVYSLNFDK